MSGDSGRSGDWVRYWRAEGQPVEAMHAHFRSHVYHRHSHDTYSFGVTETGAQAFACRGGQHVSAPGMVMTFNPDDPHDGHAATEPGFTYRMIHIGPALVTGLLADTGGTRPGRPLFPLPVVADTALAGELRQLHAVLTGTSTPLERHEHLTATVTRLARHAADGGRRPGPGPGAAGLAVAGAATRIRDLLHDRYASPLTADDLAAVADCSRYAAYRAFSAAFGLAPSEYQRQLRLRSARRLLGAGMPVARVAAETGFADQAHLTRWFRRCYGVTPGAYRSASRLGLSRTGSLCSSELLDGDRRVLVAYRGEPVGQVAALVRIEQGRRPPAQVVGAAPAERLVVLTLFSHRAAHDRAGCPVARAGQVAGPGLGAGAGEEVRERLPADADGRKRRWRRPGLGRGFLRRGRGSVGRESGNAVGARWDGNGRHNLTDQGPDLGPVAGAGSGLAHPVVHGEREVARVPTSHAPTGRSTGRPSAPSSVTSTRTRCRCPPKPSPGPGQGRTVIVTVPPSRRERLWVIAFVTSSLTITVSASAHGWSRPSATATNSRARATCRGCPGTWRVARRGRAVTGGPRTSRSFRKPLDSLLSA